MNQVEVKLKREKIGFHIIAIFGIVSIIGMFLMQPVSQNLAYHEFVDANTFANIPNFLNVISNIPFFIVGGLGLYKLNTITQNKIQYSIFFLGIICVSIGSGYYHLNPNNNTLVWDRLPMTIVFMSLVSIIISEFISVRKGVLLLFPMLVIGLLSNLYWMIFDDLKFYALVQFYPMLLIPVILVLYKSKYTQIFGYWLLLLAYVIAKIFEYFDNQIFSILKIISGHSLKHIVSAIGLFILVRTYIKREEIGSNNSKI